MTTVFGKELLPYFRVAWFSQMRDIYVQPCLTDFPAASTAPPDIQLDADTLDSKTITSGLKDYFRYRAAQSGRFKDSFRWDIDSWSLMCVQVSGRATTDL